VRDDPGALHAFRSTVNVTSGSTAGTAGSSVTVVQDTWTVPQNGFVAVGAGAVSPETFPGMLPTPVAVQ
jgi:hypothetical protein